MADTWSALGGELKPSLDVVVTAPMNIARNLPAGPPVLEQPRLGVIAKEPVSAAAGPSRDRSRRDRGAGKGRSAEAEAPDHSETASVAAGGRVPATADSGGPSGDVPDETFVAGAPDAPGRRIRVRQLPRR